jgi:hypothetical protein
MLVTRDTVLEPTSFIVITNQQRSRISTSTYYRSSQPQPGSFSFRRPETICIKRRNELHLRKGVEEICDELHLQILIEAPDRRSSRVSGVSFRVSGRVVHDDDELSVCIRHISHSESLVRLMYKSLIILPLMLLLSGLLSV